jgi:hypothetical protein
MALSENGAEREGRGSPADARAPSMKPGPSTTTPGPKHNPPEGKSRSLTPAWNAAGFGMTDHGKGADREIGAPRGDALGARVRAGRGGDGEEGGEGSGDELRQRGAIAGGEKFVAGGFHGQQLRARRDELQRGGQFVDGGEAIAGSVKEQRGSAEVREVSGAQLRGRLGRMQRIGKQEQRVDESWVRSGEHRGLASAVGMAAQEDTSWNLALERFDGLTQTLLVALGAAALRGSVRTQLAERQIAA